MEKILCAAIHYNDGIYHHSQPKGIIEGIVICGYRHNNCISLLALFYPNGEYKAKCIQGFLTSKNRFVNREEGAQLWKEQGGVLNYSNELFSEDLY